MTKFVLPMAVLPDGADPATFYATFTGHLTAERIGDAVTAWVAADPALATVHAPMKAALRFDPVGGELVLQTWPLTYADLQPLLPSPVPAQLAIGNLDLDGVRAAVRQLYVVIGRPETSVDAFLAGDGLLLVEAGTVLGTAAPDAAAPDPARPHRVTITATDADGGPVNVTQLFADGAALGGIDATLHPLLTTIDVEGWLEVLVLDAAGAPIPGARYELHLADGAVRSGTADADGLVAESGLPPGVWGLDLPDHPSFAFIEPGA